MKAILNYFTDPQIINQYTQMTKGQSHIAGACIVVFALAFVTAIVKALKSNDTKKSHRTRLPYNRATDY